MPNKFKFDNFVPGTNTNSNYSIPYATQHARQSFIYRPRNMGDIEAERAVRERLLRATYDRSHGKGTYNAKLAQKATLIEIAKAKQEDTVALMAGGAADAIDASMGIMSMIPEANLVGDAYFALKGSKDLSLNNYIGAALNTIPISASVLGRGLTAASPYIRTGIDNLSSKLGLTSKLTSHLLGDAAVKMFKDYGGTEIPKGSELGDLLRQYVYLARKQYGLLDNKNISDEEIAQSLYKEMMQNKSGAITNSGEPMIGFRGDTKQYSKLISRKTAELYEKDPSGSADNVLGTLFLGEYPNKNLGLGSERYLNGYVATNPSSSIHPTINSTYVKAKPEEGLIKADADNDPHYFVRNNLLLTLTNNKVADGHWVGTRFIPNDESVNDINAFMFKSNGVLDKTGQINPETKNIQEAYRHLAMVDEANKKNIGLIKSDPNENLEHEGYTYIALPNFNLMGAKHILPYDLRIPRDWKDPNIYRALLPIGIGATKHKQLVTPKRNYIEKHKSGGLVKQDSRYDHAVTLYNAFLDKGVNPLAALDLTNQQVAEQGWNKFAGGDGKRFPTADQYVDHTVNQMNRLYPDTLKALNFNQFFNALENNKVKYNPNPGAYKQHLLEMRNGVKKRINYYRSTLGLKPLTLITEDNTNII